jgi:PncC family amidohydrolase
MTDLTRLSAGIAEQLKARGDTVAVAETSAGGLISASLLAVPGASAYFLGGGVLYTQDSRRILLQVPDSAMEGIRSSSEPYAQLLAATMRERFETVWGVAETGAAGPTGNRLRPGGRGEDHRDRRQRSFGKYAGLHRRSAGIVCAMPIGSAMTLAPCKRVGLRG